MGRTSSTSHFMRQLRIIVVENYKDNKLLDAPIGKFIKKDLDGNRLKLMRDLTELLMETDYISDESKIYLSVPYINYQGVVDEMYLRHNKITTPSNVQSKIWYDKEKLVKALGADLPIDILEYTNRDIKHYMDKVAALRLKLTKTDLLKNVILNIPDNTVYCDSVTDEEFEEFLDTIAPYTKKCIDLVSKRLDEKVVGYVRYITTHNNLTETDRKRYQYLKDLIV